MSDVAARFRALQLPDRARPAVIAGLVVLTIAVAVLRGFIARVAPVDFGDFGPAGADILTGRLAEVYAHPVIQAGPFELALWGVPQLLGVDGPIGWGLVISAISLLVAGAIALVVHRVLRDESAAARRDATLIAVVVAFAAVATGVVTSTVVNGHPAEVVIPLLWVTAARLARRDHPFWAAVVLALGAGWEVWALLGAPVLLLAPRRLLRATLLAAAGGAAALLVLFGPFLLAGPFRMFEFRWFIVPGTLPAIWLGARPAVFPWSLRLAQGVLTLGAGAAVALLARRSRDAVWLVPLAVCAVRFLLDPLLAPYYFDQPAMLVLVVLAVALARRSLPGIVGAVLLLNVVLDLRGLGGVTAVLLLIGAAVAAVAVLRGDRDAPRAPRWSPRRSRSGSARPSAAPAPTPR